MPPRVLELGQDVRNTRCFQSCIDYLSPPFFWSRSSDRDEQCHKSTNKLATLLRAPKFQTNERLQGCDSISGSAETRQPPTSGNQRSRRRTLAPRWQFNEPFVAFWVIEHCTLNYTPLDSYVRKRLCFNIVTKNLTWQRHPYPL